MPGAYLLGFFFVLALSSLYWCSCGDQLHTDQLHADLVRHATRPRCNLGGLLRFKCWSCLRYADVRGPPLKSVDQLHAELEHATGARCKFVQLHAESVQLHVESVQLHAGFVPLHCWIRATSCWIRATSCWIRATSCLENATGAWCKFVGVKGLGAAVELLVLHIYACGPI